MDKYKRNIKLNLTKNLEDVLNELIKEVDESSSIFNELIQQKGRLDKIKKDDRNGIVTYETLTIEYNKIRFSLSEIISSLSKSDLRSFEKIEDIDELEVLFQEAENFNKKIEFEKEKDKILRNNIGLHFALLEFEKLYNYSKEEEEKYKVRTNFFFNSILNKKKNKFIVYAEGGMSLSFEWLQHYYDSLKYSKLVVNFYNYPAKLEEEGFIFYEKEWQCLDSDELRFDLSIEWMKGWQNTKTDFFYETKTLIEQKFKELLKLIIENKKIK